MSECLCARRSGTSALEEISGALGGPDLAGLRLLPFRYERPLRDFTPAIEAHERPV